MPAMDALCLRPRLRPLLAAVLACAAAAATAAAELPGRGENCIILFQGRGSCAGDLTCLKVGNSNFESCEDPLDEGAACNNFDSQGFAGCNVGLYCEANKCVRAKGVGENCEKDSECGKTARCGVNRAGPKCIDFAAQDGNCVVQTDCANGLQCIAIDGAPATCQPRVGEGGSCQLDLFWYVDASNLLAVLEAARTLYIT